MPVVRVRKSSFSGWSKVASRDPDSLAAILRGVIIHEARSKLYAASLTAITDNTTGVAALPLIAAQPIPAMNALSGSNGAQLTAFNTSLGKIRNVTAVWVAALNAVATYLNVERLTYSEGTVATPYTAPALDTSASTASIATAVDYSSTYSAMQIVAQNIDVISTKLTELLNALGQTRLVDRLGVSARSFSVLQLVPVPVNAATSLKSMLATDVTAWLAAVANNFATMAAAWNQQVIGDHITLTDSSGGTAAAALAANALPAAAAGAATTSAPKAGFDTQLAVIKNAIASMARAYNEMSYTLAGAIPQLNDFSGGTVSTTLAAISASLTAVDGSSGTLAVDQASARDRMTKIDNVTLLNTAVNTWLAGTKNNVATVAATLNACSAELGLLPLSVIAG
jgi:hypothetical protein